MIWGLVGLGVGLLVGAALGLLAGAMLACAGRSE